MNIGQLKVGQKARILALQAGNRAYRQRLVAMGLLPGTEFTVKRKAPLGDPIEIEIRGFALSLRKDEARLLEVIGY